MKNMTDFDRTFKRIFWTTFTVIGLLMVTQIVFLVWAGTKVAHEISDGHGMKGIVETVWCGEGNKCLTETADNQTK